MRDHSISILPTYLGHVLDMAECLDGRFRTRQLPQSSEPQHADATCPGFEQGFMLVFKFICTMSITHAGETLRNPYRRLNPIATPSKINTAVAEKPLLARERQLDDSINETRLIFTPPTNYSRPQLKVVLVFQITNTFIVDIRH